MRVSKLLSGCAFILYLQHSLSSEHTECTPVQLTIFDNGEATEGVTIGNLCLNECIDVSEFLCSNVGKSANCTFYDSQGNYISNCQDLSKINILFAVDHGRMFIWPGYNVGHRQTVTRISAPGGEPLVMETVALHPRIFRLINFFSDSEASEFVSNALSIEDPEHRLRRSSVGATGYTTNPKRTSEGAFDTQSPAAIAIKKRSFDLLAIYPFDETYSDGLQVLRYNQTAAYVDHMDYLETNLGNEHNYDSINEGTNRFATVLLYLTDVAEGGETVFTRVLPDGSPMLGWETSSSSLDPSPEENEAASQMLESMNLTHLFPAGTWEHRMVAQCRSRLAVRPKRLEAILFYSQQADGSPDRLSLHGGCPVLQGEKWAANLWVWSGPRTGYTVVDPETRAMRLSSSGLAHATRPWGKHGPEILEGNPDNEDPPIVVHAEFSTEVDMDGVELFWEQKNFGVLSPGKPIFMTTYAGHTWTARRRGNVIHRWVVAEGQHSQRFVVPAGAGKVGDHIDAGKETPDGNEEL